jgi:DNA-binding response OmpR family regulator
MQDAKILIVDDDPDLTSALKVTLETKNYTVIIASDKEEGMEKLKSENPDIAILDVMMDTWQDGFELAREIRKEEQFKNLPLLMLTGVKDKTGIEFKSTAGDPTWLPVDSFLDKPVEPEVLLAEVEKLLTKIA